MPNRPNEIKYLRNLNSKHFDKGNGELVMDAHTGHIHYFDKLDSKRFREINWNLQWDNIRKGWYFNYHSFKPFLPEYSNEWVEFRDLFDGKDQTIKYKAICNKVKGRLVVPDKDDKISSSNYIIYDNAFGEGIDYILYFTRSSLKKVIKIRNGYKPNQDIKFDFEIEFPDGKKIQRGINKENLSYELDLTKDKEFNTNKQTLIGNDEKDSKEWFTYLRGFKVWDNEKSETIKVKYYIKDGKKYIQKIVSKEFLDKAVGDIFTDTTISYYAGTGDGRVGHGGGGLTWTQVHNAETGNDANHTNTEDYQVYVSGWAGTGGYIYRGFLPTDTSALPDTANISAAVLYMYIKNVDDSGSSIDIVQTTQANTGSLTTADYDAVDSTSGGNADLTPWNAAEGQYHTITLNATGRGWISKTGITKIGTRDHNDLIDNNPLRTNTDQFQIRCSEYAETGSDPYLSVTYTAIESPTVTTQAVTSIEETTATGNGNITATGGENASAWGVCYKTSSGPTTSDSTAAGSGSGGTGAFTASITSLTKNTKYYLKAYATNTAGTSYGSEVTFVTDNSDTFTGDANLKKEISTTLTGNANLKGEEAITFLGDSNLKITDILATFTGDASLKSIKSVTFVGDASLKSEETATFTGDACTVETRSGTFTGDAALKTVEVATFTGDSNLISKISTIYAGDTNLVRENISVTFAGNSCLVSTVSDTFTGDASLKSIESTTFTGDTNLKKLDIVSTFTSDTNLKSSESITFTGNASLINIILDTFTGNANLKSIESIDFTGDTNLKAVNIVAIYTGDASLKAIIAVVFTGDASLKSIEAATFIGDASLKYTESTTFAGDSVIMTKHTSSFLGDANLSSTELLTFTGDTLLKKTSVIGFAGIITLNNDQQTYGYGLTEDMEFLPDNAPEGTEYPLDL